MARPRRRDATASPDRYGGQRQRYGRVPLTSSERSANAHADWRCRHCCGVRQVFLPSICALSDSGIKTPQRSHFTIFSGPPDGESRFASPPNFFPKPLTNSHARMPTATNNRIFPMALPPPLHRNDFAIVAQTEASRVGSMQLIPEEPDGGV